MKDRILDFLENVGERAMDLFAAIGEKAGAFFSNVGQNGGNLLHSLRRSIRRDKEQWIRGTILVVVLLAIVILVRSCACGKKTDSGDAASQGVMTITAAPTPTPTEAPREVSADATVTNDGVTMINEYLVQQENGTSGTVSSAETENSEGTQETGSTETTEVQDP